MTKIKPPSGMRKGQRVTVYQKPVTKEQPEGEAVLHRFEGMGNESYFPNGPQGEERTLELWSVFFDGDKKLYDRMVSPQDKAEQKAPSFQVLRLSGKTFLLIPTGSGRDIGVMDSEGNTYGSYRDAEAFRAWHKAGKATALGKGRVLFQFERALI